MPGSWISHSILSVKRIGTRIVCFLGKPVDAKSIEKILSSVGVDADSDKVIFDFVSFFSSIPLFFIKCQISIGEKIIFLSEGIMTTSDCIDELYALW